MSSFSTPPSLSTSRGQDVLNQCIIHGFGSLGSRIVGVIEDEKTWKSAGDVPFRIVAIVERDSGRRVSAQTQYPLIPCFDNIKAALAVFTGPNTFIKDFTSPIGRTMLLDAARSVNVPVLLEKPLSSPGVKVSLAGRENEASVSMSEAYNPVLRALADRLASNATQIRSLAFVRINSLTLERLRDPHARLDIIGGAFVDKLTHDIHLLISGALLGSTDIEFGLPQIQEIAFDARATKDPESVLSFTSLDGAPLSSSEVETSESNLSEMMVDLSISMQLKGHPVPTRWIASWCGLPTDLAKRLGISNDHVEAAHMVSNPDTNAVGREAYPISNLKLIVCNYINLAGDEVQLICNPQTRGNVTAWLVEERNGEEYRYPVRYSVSVLNSMIAFSQRFRTGGYLNLASIEKANRTVLEIRSQFRKPLAEEVQIERSLAMLDRNHTGSLALAFQTSLIAPNLFVGTPSLHTGPVYGGLLIAQVIMAAAADVGQRQCHSMQASFLQRAQPQVAIQLAVSEAITGRKISVRRVTATQGDREILSATISFREPHSGIAHQPPSQDISFNPRNLVEGRLHRPPPPGIEVRWNADIGPDASKGVWMRSARPLEDSITLQTAALAYASEYSILEEGISQYGLSWQSPGLFTTSLNQSMWMLRASDFSDWHFFSIDSTAASGSTILGRMSCFDMKGNLVAMFVQEAVVGSD